MSSRSPASFRTLSSLGAALCLCALGACFDPSDDEQPSTSDGSGDSGGSETTGGPPPDDTTSSPDGTGSTTAEPATSDDTTTDDATDSSTGDTGEVPEPGGTIIPLYTYPTDPTWMQVADEALAHPEVEVVAIINPGSGPGQALDPNYEAGIDLLSDAGVVVIGYVYTAYAARPLAEVEAEIDAYASFYPALEGVMFDEMSNVPGDETYYAGLSAYATGQGLSFSVGNPGTAIPETFVDTVDAMFVYESAGLPDPAGFDPWLDDYDGENFAIIPHTVMSLEPGFVGAALEHVGWIYVTDDALPNPWDTLPPYFGDLMDQLEAG